MIKKVLIVLPTYNRPYLCINVINQILNQDFKNFYLLIIDDGSDKLNFNILNNYINNLKYHINVELLSNNINKKIPHTLNIGLEYFLNNDIFTHFTWISDDNEYYSNFINDLVNKEGDFIYSNFDFEENGKKRSINYIYKDIKDLINNFQGLGSFMWSRNGINKIGKYNENLYGCEDFDYLVRSILLLKNISYNNISNMKYNLHNDSLYIKENKMITNLSTNIKIIYNYVVKNINIKSFIYYSKTSWKLLFQRPHQIMRHFDNNYLKCFITSDDIVKYEEKYNLLVLPYKLKDCLFNLINNYNIYYTDPRLYYEILDLKEYNKTDKILFDLIDAPIGEFIVWRENLNKSVNMANFVIYSHPKLLEYLNNINILKEYYYISNACDYEYFSLAKDRFFPKPCDIQHINKPILGYYGAFSEWIDYDLIKKYADEDIYHILMIGGIKSVNNYNIRFKHSNITWLDHKPYEEIVKYLSWFDICFLPFKECELNKYVNPCKLWEYMATEKQIIKTNIDIECKNIIKYIDECKKIKDILNF